MALSRFANDGVLDNEWVADDNFNFDCIPTHDDELAKGTTKDTEALVGGNKENKMVHRDDQTSTDNLHPYFFRVRR